MYQKFFTQSGSSLVQVLIMSGILSMLALVGVQISQTSKLSSKGVEARDDLETLHAMAVSTLQDQVNCTATKNHCHESGKGICLAGPGGTGGETVIAPGGRYMSDSITVDHINFSVPATGTTGVVNIGYRKIHADKKASGYSAEKVTKNIPLKIIRDDDDNFARCYVDQENITEEMTSEFCQSLGTFMTWDATTKKCSLNQKTCWDQPNTMFMGISSTGQPICRNLSNIVNPNEYFSTSAIPNCPNRQSIQLTLDGSGKISIQCNSAPGGTTTGGGTTGGLTPACSPGFWTMWQDSGSWSSCSGNTRTKTQTRGCASPVINPCSPACAPDAHGSATSRTVSEACITACTADGQICSQGGPYPSCATCCSIPMNSCGCTGVSGESWRGRCGGILNCSAGSGGMSFCEL